MASVASWAESAKNNATTPKTVATTWSAGDVVIVTGGIENCQSNSLNTPTVSGLTFSLVVSTNDGNSNECGTYLWKAKAASGGSGSISVSRTGTGQWGIDVWVDTDVGDVGVSATNRSGATTNLTVEAGSIVHHFLADWSANATDQTPATGSGTATERSDGTGTTTWAWVSNDWVGTASGTIAFGLASYAGLTDTQVFVEVTGTPPTTVQEGFRFRNDDGNETAATWRQTQDVDDTAALGVPVRLRVLVDTTEDTVSTAYRLDYKLSTDSVYIPVLVGAAPAPFPIIEGTSESSVNTAGTSHAVTLPASIASTDLVLIIMDIGSTSATLNALTDWTESLDEAAANGLKILRFTGTGVPSAPTFTSSASTRSASIAYRISGADKTIAPQIGTTATGTSATPDPPTVTPTGGVSKSYLFIAFYGAAGEEADDDTWSDTPPTNYGPTPPLQKACGTAGTNLGGLIAAASRQLATGSAEDPGTFAKDVSAAWRAQTIIIHPTIPVPPIFISPSANITASGDATTAQLTAPSGKTTSDFTTGRMWDDENGTDSIDIAADFYTELEWCLKAQTPAIVNDVYQFRVTANGVALTTYTVTPQLTIVAAGTAGPPRPPRHRPPALTYR